MTPTEQDKELRRAIVNYRIKCDYYLSDRDDGVISQKEYETAISGELDTVVQLITADRKRVALEAKLEENEEWRLFSKEVQRGILPMDFKARMIALKNPYQLSEAQLEEV